MQSLLGKTSQDVTNLEKVVEVSKDSYANLIQVLKKAVEDGHQVFSSQLITQNQG